MITRSQKRNLPVFVKTEKQHTEKKQCDHLKQLKQNQCLGDEENTIVIPRRKKEIISCSDIEDAVNASSPLPPDFEFVWQGRYDY
jgi:hypothetical protein